MAACHFLAGSCQRTGVAARDFLRRWRVTAVSGGDMNLKLNRELQDLCINTIRILSADAVQNANAGHRGMPMGAAAMA
jgi:hypothetical protein